MKGSTSVLVKLAIDKQVRFLLLPEVAIVRHEMFQVAPKTFNICVPALELTEQGLLPCHGTAAQTHSSQ